MHSWEQIDEELGTYMPISRILQMEGGAKDKAAVLATRNYVAAAYKMGGQWLLFNKMTRRTDILYLKNKQADLQDKMDHVHGGDRGCRGCTAAGTRSCSRRINGGGFKQRHQEGARAFSRWARWGCARCFSSKTGGICRRKGA